MKSDKMHEIINRFLQTVRLIKVLYRLEIMFQEKLFVKNPPLPPLFWADEGSIAVKHKLWCDMGTGRGTARTELWHPHHARWCGNHQAIRG